MRLRGGDFLILAWHGLGGDDDAIELYRERWRIETLFQKLKGHGFNLEESRLRGGHKAETLLGVLALAAAWCYALGEWHSEEVAPIPRKKPRAQGRGDVSSRAKHIATGLRQVRGKTKPRRKTGLFLDKLQIKVGQQVAACNYHPTLKIFEYCVQKTTSSGPAIRNLGHGPRFHHLHSMVMTRDCSKRVEAEIHGEFSNVTTVAACLPCQHANPQTVSFAHFANPQTLLAAILPAGLRQALHEQRAFSVRTRCESPPFCP